MSVLVGQNVARSFGADDIFQNVSVSIPHGARIALVGPNGTGKTTLLRILAGLDDPSEGKVMRAKGVRIGVLHQEADLSLDGQKTLHDEMLLAFSDLLAQEARVHDLAEQLAHRSDDTELLEAYGQAQMRFEAEGGYEFPLRIQQVLGGLGFEEADFTRPISQLSGGQKTRALLGRLLLEEPDLLILDEPTNHLDIQAIEWLEHWLKNFRGALLVVSHDRYFMDNVVTQVWELIFGQLEEYKGTYSAYARQREERHTFLLNEYERQQEHVRKTEDYIARNIAGQNTRQAQGRRKRLERFLRDEAILRPRELRAMRLRLDTHRISGEKVITTKNLMIGYHDDGVPLFSVPDISLMRGECAALIGPNGAGKSTFLKTILSQLAPLEGQSVLGSSVEIGYFAQAHEGLKPDNTILDEILRVKNLPISETRSYLASFLFTSDDVYKPISTLSGGERGRVALAKLALSGANLLLLDEPSNHLDLLSQEILETVLAEFEGTILLVSHDRYLIRNLATQIWAVGDSKGDEAGQSEMVVYKGGYDEYIAWRDNRELPSRKSSNGAPRQPVAQTESPPPKKRSLSPAEHKKRLEKLEANIHQLEAGLNQLGVDIEAASTAGDVGKVALLGEEYIRSETELNRLMQQWEALLAE
jgi:ATP-binding cassette subfamily F protein 3